MHRFETAKNNYVCLAVTYVLWPMKTLHLFSVNNWADAFLKLFCQVSNMPTAMRHLVKEQIQI